MNQRVSLHTSEIERMGAEAQKLVSTACLTFMNASHFHLLPAPREIRKTAVAGQRNSVIYRFDSLAFHLHLIEFILTTHVRMIPLESHERSQRKDLLHSAARQLMFTLDDLIFNCASLFDYWAGLVSIIFVGAQAQNCKWNQLERLVGGQLAKNANAGQTFLRDSSTARRVKFLHSTWIDALFGYRSDLIHTSSEKPQGNVTHRWEQGGPLQTTINIPIPKKLAKKVRFLGVTESDSELLVQRAGAQIYQQTYLAIADLSLSLRSDIRDFYGDWGPFDATLR